MGSQHTHKAHYDVDEFDLLLVTASDIHGVSRGRFVFRKSVHGIMKNGLGMAQASLFSGVLCDIPLCLTEYGDQGWTNGTLVPDSTTVRPLSWLSYGDKKVGHVLCDFLSSQGEREVSMSREVANRQVQGLNDLGYVISVSAQLEVMVFHKNSLNPVLLHEDITTLTNTLMTSLLSSGIPVISIGKGLEPGKLLIGLEPQTNLEVADCLHRLRSMLKSLCVNAGYDVTFMTRPLASISPNIVSYRFTLLDANGRNVFDAADDQMTLSEVGQGFAAGLLAHQQAMTALVRPTLNCYSQESPDITVSWTNDPTHSARLLIDNSQTGPHIEDRLPTLASNPYIALASIIAAGTLDIRKKLKLSPELSDSTPDEEGPQTLLEALDRLEKDETLTAALCPKFVKRFLLLKKNFEINRLEEKSSDRFEFERSIYLRAL
ncbi:lengsin-like isoform X2 [Physella acuta]|uniref:lengsin-like isoform X2 n=1 Tax=Physella acuta TaxID=109671 RepID=UPI0027DE6C6F|nr:lengsin-like isoform X2 [Physella acuta]